MLLTTEKIICADDFGMSSAVDLGIVALLQHQKINAVSCMTNADCWNSDATLLKPFLDKAKIGLHFNLPYQSLVCFIAKSYLRLLDKKMVLQALLTQYNHFVACLGRQPDFIDGHQHIHQLPVVREVLIDFYLSRYPNREAFIRNTQNKQKSFKAYLIRLLGCKKLSRLLKTHCIPHNNVFTGIYTLSSKANYSILLQGFLKDIEQGGLLMCHPALLSDLSQQERFRYQEFQVLNAQESLALRSLSQ